MRVTGYQLREAIKVWELRKDAASRMFDDSLKIFPGDNKDHPQVIIASLIAAEIAIAKLQTAQSKYNLAISFPFEGDVITLCEAVKSLGGYARVEKLWRATAGEKKEKYSYRDTTERDPTKEYATYVVKPAESAAAAAKAAKVASTLRALIAQHNSREIFIEGLDAKLLD